ncbi:efflux RND transporter periplasmic adaptor subunit [candidate division KSB1 bacterium]|nr:efflux RND transporter periplasmic adaptor subunit [candidate division KSB1 bacterium]
MKIKTYFTFIFLVALSMLFGSCGKKNEQTTGTTTDALASEMNVATTTQIPVEVLVIKRKNIEQNIPLSGVIQPIHEVDIIAEVSGQVTKINKELGEAVTTRDTLAWIDDKVARIQYQQARSQVLSAENNLKIAELNLQSDKELYQAGDISDLEFENSKLAVKSAQASLLSARANYDMMEKQYHETRITTPINGVIARKSIDIGTMVTPTAPVYRVVQMNQMKIQVGVAQDLVGKLRIGDKAAVRIGALGNVEFDGKVAYISPQADESTGAFTAEIHVVNTPDNQIRAGMSCRVELLVTDLGQQLVVPDYALVPRNGSKFIYQIQGGKAVLKKVDTGSSFGSYVVVNDGLAVGDTVVTVGMKKLGVDTPVYIEAVN